MTTDLRHLLAIYVHAHQTGNSVPPHIDAEARAAPAEETAAPLPIADAVATAESECLYVLSTATDRPLTPHLIEDFYRQFCGIIAGLVDALGKDKPTAPAPPADGEVAELTGQLIEAANGAAAMGWDKHAQSILRAAELLQRRVVVPVAVSERLPGPGECDVEGRCWAGTRAFVDTSGDCDIDYPPSWELREVCAQDDVWLPAHALPEVGE